MQTPKRYKEFQIAMAHTGIGVAYFADKHNVTKQHIYHVLKGIKTSQYIIDDIDDFIHEAFESLKIQYFTEHRAA